MNCCAFANFEQKNDTSCKINYVIKILKILHDNFVLCSILHYIKFVNSYCKLQFSLLILVHLEKEIKRVRIRVLKEEYKLKVHHPGSGI